MAHFSIYTQVDYYCWYSRVCKNIFILFLFVKVLHRNPTFWRSLNRDAVLMRLHFQTSMFVIPKKLCVRWVGTVHTVYPIQYIYFILFHSLFDRDSVAVPIKCNSYFAVWTHVESKTMTTFALSSFTLLLSIWMCRNFNS